MKYYVRNDNGELDTKSVNKTLIENVCKVVNRIYNIDIDIDVIYNELTRGIK